MAINKVVYGNRTLIDLTSDTVDAAHLLEGVKAHDKSGNVIVGENTFDADTSDATAAVAEILATKSAYVGGEKLVGTMPNRGGASGTIATKNGSYAIQQGYHDGSGAVTLDPTEAAKLIPGNIRQGITVFGVEGDMSGTEDVNAQTKTAVPSSSSQTILPDETFNYLSSVVVEPIPYTETDNAAGGTTVSIG